MLNRSAIICLVFFVSSLVSVCFGQCKTSDNPTCGNDQRFNSIICCAPNTCYWQDRQQTPGCCPSGQVCGVIGNPQPVVKNGASTLIGSSTGHSLSTLINTLSCWGSQLVASIRKPPSPYVVGSPVQQEHFIVNTFAPDGANREARLTQITSILLPLGLVIWNGF